MVLPGIQALFGFQLIAVFNEGFSRKLDQTQQQLHLAAIVLVVVAIALVMAPAAIHRQTSQREVGERFIWIASRLMLASMVPLALGLCAEVYLVSIVVLHARALGAAIAAALLAVFILAWIVLPRIERGKES
jgi:cytochrome bd-type quinol oxidase subunit 2